MTVTTKDAKNPQQMWAVALDTDSGPNISSLAKLIFNLSPHKEKLEAGFVGSDKGDLTSKIDTCLTLITSSLTRNDLRSLGDLGMMQETILTNISKITSSLCFMPNTLVSVLVMVKKYLSLKCIHPSLPAIKDVTRLQLVDYMQSWDAVKGKGLFPPEETISFDGSCESWPGFRIELTGILIKHGFRELFLCAKNDAGVIPERLFFQSQWLGRVLSIAVNFCPLRWPMHEGGTCGVALLLWLKVKYESEAKVDPMNAFFHDKLSSLKLRAGGSLHDYIDKFQGLVILWREINPMMREEEKLVQQMVSQIEDPLFSGPCESIGNWDKSRQTFHDAAATLRGHEINKCVARTKKEIENEVNSLLMGNCSVKRRVNGEAKAIRGFKTGDSSGNGSGDTDKVPYRVWKMLSLEAKLLIKSGKEGKIGIAEGSVGKAGGRGGEKMSKANKKRRTNLLRLCAVDGKSNPDAVKDLDELLASVGE